MAPACGISAAISSLPIIIARRPATSPGDRLGCRPRGDRLEREAELELREIVHDQRRRPRCAPAPPAAAGSAPPALPRRNSSSGADAMSEEPAGAAPQLDVEAREGRLGRPRRQDQRHAEQRADRSHLVHRLGIAQVIGDQPDRAIVHRRLRRRLQQSGGEARVEDAKAARGRVGMGRNVPIAGGRVVHGVVEAGRRHLAMLRGQALENAVQRIAIAAGRGEDGGRLHRVAPRALEGLGADRQRQLHRLHGPAPLVRRQQRAWRHDGRSGDIGFGPGQHRAARGPARQSRTAQPHAFHIDFSSGAPEQQAAVGAAEAE